MTQLSNIDSFAHYTNVLYKYAAGSNAVISPTVGRNGFPGIITNGTTFFLDELTLYGQQMRLSGVVHGIAFQWSEFDNCVLFQYQESDGTVQITVALTNAGLIQVYRGTTSGTLLATSAAPLSLTPYYHIESKVFINDTTGTVEVRVHPDKDTTVVAINFTGDTRNAGTGLISKISYGIAGASPKAHWCDKYTCDLVGATFNDFLGNKSCGALLPSGAGSEETWIPTPNVANWNNVNSVPANLARFNESPDINLITVPTSDLFAKPNASGSSLAGVAVNLGVKALPVVERVGGVRPYAFWLSSELEFPPITTTDADTKAGNLVLVALAIPSSDPLSVTPTQTGFTLLSHQRANYGGGPVFYHYLVFWRLAAADGSTAYDFTEATDFFTLTEDVLGYIVNSTLRNQTGSWEFDIVTAQKDGIACTPEIGCPPNTLFVPGTAAPDTYGHFNYIIGFSPYGGSPGSHPDWEITPSFGPSYGVYDNGSAGADTGLFAFGLRAVRGIQSPDLTIDFNATFSFNNGCSFAVSLDIKPRTEPPGIVDDTLGARIGGDESFGLVPTKDEKNYQFPFQTAPGSVPWATPSQLNAIEVGYEIAAPTLPVPTLTISSTNPVSGTTIAISPDDNAGDTDGATPFQRDYNLDTAVTLTAPGTASGNPFSKWKKDGVDDAITQAVQVQMDTDHTLQAVYTASSCPVGDDILLLDGSTMPAQGDGSEITAWTDGGIHGYAWVNYPGKLGPRYDTTQADNVLYNGFVSGIDRALFLDTPINTDLGLPGAFTLIYIMITEAGAPGTINVMNVDQLDGNAGWALQLNTFGANFSVAYEQYNGSGYLGSIDSPYIYPKASQNKLLVEVVCDGVDVRMLVNGAQLVGPEWFNNNDSSSNYLSSSPSTASNAAIGSRAFVFANRYYGQMPFIRIRNINLSDADRQAIAVPAAAAFGITYVPGACSVGCVP